MCSLIWNIFQIVQVQGDQAGGLHSLQLCGQTQVNRGGTVSTLSCYHWAVHQDEFTEVFGSPPRGPLQFPGCGHRDLIYIKWISSHCGMWSLSSVHWAKFLILYSIPVFNMQTCNILEDLCLWPLYGCHIFFSISAPANMEFSYFRKFLCLLCGLIILWSISVSTACYPHIYRISVATWNFSYFTLHI